MWYYIANGQQNGPLPTHGMANLIRNGQITKDTKVWKKGLDDWVFARETELLKYFHSAYTSPSFNYKISSNYTIYPALEKMQNGSFLIDVLSTALRVLGVLAALSGVFFVVSSLKLTFSFNETEYILAGLLISLLLAVAFYIIMQTWFFHAKNLSSEDVKRYPIITTISHLLRIIGENVAVIGLSVAVCGMLVFWFRLPQFLNDIIGLNPLIYNPRLSSSEFVAGLIFLGVNVIVTFFVLLVFYFLAEMIEISVDISKNLFRIEQRPGVTKIDLYENLEKPKN